ncbi:MAG: hypothetical protein JXB49_23550 [Bacteroidales bacterium]|nr:hypothetical protein [Bacteroidales bacterium]
MEIRYQIFKKDKLLIQNFIGTFSIEKYGQFIAHIMKNAKSTDIDKVLIDFRDMEFEDEGDNLFIYLDKMTDMRKNIEAEKIKRKDIIHVFWVDKPLPTVIAHLFASNFPDSYYKYATTAEKVISTLNLPEYFSNLDVIMKNLELSY